MKRYLILAVLLALAAVVAMGAISGLVFHHVDLRFVAFLQLVLIPFIQAAIVLWVSGSWGLDRLVAGARGVRYRPAILALIVADVALLAAGWVFHLSRLIGLAGTPSLHPWWMGTKALVAAIVLTLIAFAPRSRLVDRLWLGVFAAAVAALGVEFYRPWLATLPAMVPGRLPLVVRWVLVYGGPFILAMAAVLHTETVLARREELAGFLTDASAACAALVALVTVPNLFLRPFLVEPWLSVVRSGVSLMLTLLLAASLAALVPRAGGHTSEAAR